MAAENIRSELDEEDCCNICYDNECETSSLITLKCCNDSKKIYVKCVNCLKTPICPYCRKTLDSTCTPFMNKNAIPRPHSQHEVTRLFCHGRIFYLKKILLIRHCTMIQDVCGE